MLRRTLFHCLTRFQRVESTLPKPYASSPFAALKQVLPQADIKFSGVEGWISQSTDHQIVFMEINKGMNCELSVGVVGVVLIICRRRSTCTCTRYAMGSGCIRIDETHYRW